MKTFSVRRAATALAAAAFATGLAVAATGCASHTSGAAAASSGAAGAGPATSSSTSNSVDSAQTTGTPAAASPSSAPAADESSNPVKLDAVGNAHTSPVVPALSTPGTTTAPKPSVPQPPPPIPPSSLPDAAVAAWQPMGSMVTMSLPANRGIGVGECLMVDGAAAWNEQGYISAQQTPAQEDVFGFADEASAAKAYRSMGEAMGGCQQVSRTLQSANRLPADATVALTGQATQAQAWSRAWTGVPGQSMAGPQIDHYYLVQRGAAVIVAGFTETGSGLTHPYETAGDPAVLTMLTAHAGG